MTTLTELLEPFGFDEILFDEETVLFTDVEDGGAYAVLTDEDGIMPCDVDQPLLFSVYSGDDSFQWSVSLEHVHALIDILQEYPDWPGRLTALRQMRDANFVY